MTTGNTLESYPLDANGELAYHPQRIEPVTEAPNTPFADTMTYDGYQRATSSPLYFWKGTDGRTWPMSLADMDLTLKGASIIKGSITGIWRVRKRGVVYGLEWMGESAP